MGVVDRTGGPGRCGGSDGRRDRREPALTQGAVAAPSPGTACPDGVLGSPRVLILLSTCNGAAFLPDQLQSFLAQTHSDWVLLWRDDGSTDDTVAVVEAFAAGCDRCVRVRDPCGRLGPAASFLLLLREARPMLRATDLVAFSDQDDVWLPGKLARGVAALAAADPDAPTLYCARQVLVDEALRPVGHSRRLRRAAVFPASLVQNVASGCTMMLNRGAVALVADGDPPAVTFHDWWCYLLVTAAGGRCLCDDAEVMLYRQHDGNCVGAPRSAARRALAAARRGPAAFMDLLRGHLAALAARPDVLSEVARRDVARVQAALRSGMIRRMAVVRSVGLRRQALAETAVLYLWFLVGGRAGGAPHGRDAARGWGLPAVRSGNGPVMADGQVQQAAAPPMA